MLEDKSIGLLLAIASSLAIGSSYVITKQGLQDASRRHGFDGDGHQYLKNPTWWAGMVMLVIGEGANFAAYAFAPAILVTPLGALSVLTGAVLGTYFLGERLGVLGKLGCATCFIGSVLIASHAPPDKPIETVDEILNYAIQPGRLMKMKAVSPTHGWQTGTGFLFFCLVTGVFSIVMIFMVAPKYGTRNPLYYLSICAATGSVSVMAVKAFGIALKLTIDGKNQFTHPSTYAFAIVVVVCILTQMNYFNKALSTFSQSMYETRLILEVWLIAYRVSPVYYVTFTTAVLTASFILFQGFNTTDGVSIVSLLCGFLIIFSGVYLLNLSEQYPDGRGLSTGRSEHSIPTDGITGIQTRLSMQSYRSLDPRRGSNGSITFSPQTPQDDRDGLMHSFEIESGRYIMSDLSTEHDIEAETTHPLCGNGKPAMNGSLTERHGSIPN